MTKHASWCGLETEHAGRCSPSVMITVYGNWSVPKGTVAFAKGRTYVGSVTTAEYDAGLGPAAVYDAIELHPDDFEILQRAGIVGKVETVQ